MINVEFNSRISITLSEDQIKTKILEDSMITLDRLEFPKDFIEWQSKSRLQMFIRLNQAGAGAIHSQPAHLPVVGTLGEGNFPINLACRGIGLLPKTEVISQYIDLLNEAKFHTATIDVQDSLPYRVKPMRQFYETIKDIDPMILGGLEIFEGKTFANIRANPFVSIIYSGEPPHFPSYQFNCIAEILLPEDIRYQFLLAARELFAFDAFHITQNSYPFGYAFHLVEIIDKTPYPRK